MLPTSPTDSGTGAPVDPVLSRPAAYALLASVAGGASDTLAFGTNVTVALLTGAPTLNVSTGEYDISTVELTTGTAPGYARFTLTRATAFGAPASAGPATVGNSVQAVSPVATVDWPGFNAVALVDNAGKVVAWKSLTTAVYVLAGQTARVPVAGLVFYTPSA